jgi:hypothetical protein
MLDYAISNEISITAKLGTRGRYTSLKNHVHLVPKSGLGIFR